jgi:hypothetical protein
MAEDESLYARWSAKDRRALGRVFRELGHGERSSVGRPTRGDYDGRSTPGIEGTLRTIESFDLSGISVDDLPNYRDIFSKGWQGDRGKAGRHDNADQLKLDSIRSWIVGVAIVRGDGPLSSLAWNLPRSLSEAEIVYNALNKKFRGYLGLPPVAEEEKASYS